MKISQFKFDVMVILVFSFFGTRYNAIAGAGLNTENIKKLKSAYESVNLKYFAEGIEWGSDHLNLAVIAILGGQHLILVDGDKESTKIYLDYEVPTEAFIRAEVVRVPKMKKEYLLTFWTHGAHGEELRVLDRNEKNPLVYSISASFGLRVSIHKDGRLEILKQDDQGVVVSQGKFKSEFWPKK